MKKYTPYIFIALLIAAIIYLLMKRAKGTGPGSLVLKKSDWETKVFTFKSPFGEITVHGLPPSAQEQIVKQDNNYVIGIRRYEDHAEVYMSHLNTSDPIHTEMYYLDYTLSTSFPTTVTSDQFVELSNGTD